MKLSVVFSFYNEEDVLEELVTRIRKVLAQDCACWVNDYELIFVNDTSTDRSLEILMQLREQKKDIKIINMSRNFGVSVCVLAGMKYATGEAVVYMDTDLQDPPEFIPQMVQAMVEKKVDVVHTRRKRRMGETKIKLWITKLGYFILGKLSKEVIILPEVGDFKLLSRRAVKELLKLEEKRPFLRGLVNWIGFPSTTLEYERQSRGAGDTKFPVIGRKVIFNFLDSALISFSDIPLKGALVMGFAVSILALGYIGVVLVQKIMGWHVPGWPAVMSAILFLGGVQLLTIGILGLYIGNVFLESKRRANFIVESTVGFDKD
jgi:polyisoprenyl-phosphate glycosyltransferase